mgnify:CR=1 FL=1
MKKLYKDLRKFNEEKIDKTLLFNTKEKDDTGRKELFKEQRKKYGFDERETWCLGYTSILWLYCHLKRFRDWGGAIEMNNIDETSGDNYIIKIAKKDENGNYIYKERIDENKYIILEKEKVKLPFGKVIDIICEYLEYFINYADGDAEKSKIAYSLVKDAMKLYGLIIHSLWW